MEKLKSDYDKILFRAGVQVNDFLYYSDWNSNGLFELDIKNNCTRVIATFESNMIERLHEFAFAFNNEIWFIPSDMHEKIAIYNLDEEIIRYLDIPKYKGICNNRPFMGCYIKHNNAWFFPASIAAILEVNLITGTMRYHYLLNEKDERELDKKRFIYSSYYVSNDKVYLCPWGEKYIITFNLSDSSIKRINIKIPQYCYKNIVIKGNEIILFPEKLDNGIVVYDIESVKQVRKMRLNCINTCDIVFQDKNKVFILPNKQRRAIILDLHKWSYDFTDILNIDEDVAWYEIRNISNRKFIIPYTERKYLVVFENGEFKILKCNHYKDEEMCQLLLKLKADK